MNKLFKSKRTNNNKKGSHGFGRIKFIYVIMIRKFFPQLLRADNIYRDIVDDTKSETCRNEEKFAYEFLGV